MEHTTRTKQKSGPVKKGYKQTAVQLPPILLSWAKHQPEGLSGLVRKLLDAERERREALAQ